MALWEITQHPAVVPALLDEIDDTWSGIQAATALWLIDRRLTAVEALAHAFRENARRLEYDEMEAAADALKQIGPEARAAVPVLVEALGDRDALVRDLAADALSRVAPAALCTRHGEPTDRGKLSSDCGNGKRPDGSGDRGSPD